MSPIITISRPDDETIAITGPGGQEIGTYTHDEHGWAGMDAVRQAVTEAVEAVGGTVEEG